MGRAKEAMLKRQDDLSLAASYLVALGHLEACEDHGTIFGGGTWKLEDDFYRRVMSDRNRGERGPIPWAKEMGAREFTDLLVEAYNANAGDSCTACDKRRAE